jgi:8-oxo-dGTP pyrophosphatase MutT (NUDIX family)
MSTIRKRSYGIIPIAFPAAGAPLFLILRAYSNWDFPKGGAEADETPLQAARRELEEETSIREFDLAWGEIYMDTGIYSGDKVARYYPARVEKRPLTLPVSPELGRPEHNEYRWLPYDRARALLPPRLTPVIDWAWQLIAGKT